MALFITLTFRIPQYGYVDDNFVYHHSTVPTCDPSHVKNFLKRFRKALQPERLRYFAVGEYGSKRGRPHYHLLCFFTRDDDAFSRLLDDSLHNSWTLGGIHIGHVTPDSIAYTVDYTVKGYTKQTSYTDGRYPDFSRYSQGLGKAAIPDLLDTSLDDFPEYYRVAGKQWVVPKYIRRKAREKGYVTSSSKSEKQLEKVLSLLPRAGSLEEIDKREEVLKEFRAEVELEKSQSDARRARSTIRMQRGFTERKKSETF
jgi:hypothetical protein